MIISREVLNRRIGQSQGVDFEDGGAKPEEDETGDELICTRKFCGGLIADLKRKKPFFLNCLCFGYAVTSKLVEAVTIASLIRYLKMGQII